uniref:Cytochrome c oxidase subunit 5A, mitochondrial n=1 Tax=Felis catus TaxID=9685 RepID=A0ABI7WVW6_FELCA
WVAQSVKRPTSARSRSRGPPPVPGSGPWFPAALSWATVQSVHCYSPESHETNEEFDAHWITYFNKPDTDACELSKGMNMLVGCDLVPEPQIIDAALQAFRQLKDFAKPHKEIYFCVIQELRPALNELEICIPEELGLDKV